MARRAKFHTVIGAFPGAAPPLIGWATATGNLDADAWILFAILFFWQFPHFLAIEIIYAEDYQRAGIEVLPNARHAWPKVSLHILGALLLLIAATVLPFLSGLTESIVYLAGALVFGVIFLAAGIRVVVTRRKLHARHLLRASVLYLPLLFALLFALR